MAKKSEREINVLAKKNVASFIVAQKLRNAGYKKPTLFFYLNTKSFGWDVICAWDGIMEDKQEHLSEPIPAPSVAELGELLPEYVGDWFLEMFKDGSHDGVGEWFLVRYVENDIDSNTGKERTKIIQGFNEPKEADARAKMLLWLIEKNHITL